MGIKKENKMALWMLWFMGIFCGITQLINFALAEKSALAIFTLLIIINLCSLKTSVR